MASLMENLIEVLGQESEEYEGLLALSQKKMRIIAGANLEDLQKITDDEQEVVSRLNRLEKRRIEVAADIANVLNKDVETMKLTNLIEMLSARPAEQAALAAVHDRLKSVVREECRPGSPADERAEQGIAGGSTGIGELRDEHAAGLQGRAGDSQLYQKRLQLRGADGCGQRRL